MKNIYALIIGLSLVALAVVLFFSSSPSQKAFEKEGQSVSSDILSLSYDKIVVKNSKYEAELSLDKSSGLWLTKINGKASAEENFLSSAQEIYNLLQKVAATKYSRKISSGEESFAEFKLTDQNLTDPSNGTSSKVIIYIESIPQLTFYFGDLKATLDKPQSGQYFRELGDDNVYLVNPPFVLPDTSTKWFNYTLLDIPKAELKEVSITKQNINYAVSAITDATDGSWELKGDSAKTLDMKKLDSFLSFMNPLKVITVKGKTSNLTERKVFTIGYTTKAQEKFNIVGYIDKSSPQSDNYLLEIDIIDIPSGSKIIHKLNYYMEKLFVISKSKLEQIDLKYFLNEA